MGSAAVHSLASRKPSPFLSAALKSARKVSAFTRMATNPTATSVKMCMSSPSKSQPSHAARPLLRCSEVRSLKRWGSGCIAAPHDRFRPRASSWKAKERGHSCRRSPPLRNSPSAGRVGRGRIWRFAHRARRQECGRSQWLPAARSVTLHSSSPPLFPPRDLHANRRGFPFSPCPKN